MARLFDRRAPGGRLRRRWHAASERRAQRPGRRGESGRHDRPHRFPDAAADPLADAERPTVTKPLTLAEPLRVTDSLAWTDAFCVPGRVGDAGTGRFAFCYADRGRDAGCGGDTSAHPRTNTRPDVCASRDVFWCDH